MLELLFALMVLQSAHFALHQWRDEIVASDDPIAKRLDLMDEVEDQGQQVDYEMIHFLRTRI